MVQQSFLPHTSCEEELVKSSDAVSLAASSGLIMLYHTNSYNTLILIILLIILSTVCLSPSLSNVIDQAMIGYDYGSRKTLERSIRSIRLRGIASGLSVPFIPGDVILSISPLGNGLLWFAGQFRCQMLPNSLSEKSLVRVPLCKSIYRFTCILYHVYHISRCPLSFFINVYHGSPTAIQVTETSCKSGIAGDAFKNSPNDFQENHCHRYSNRMSFSLRLNSFQFCHSMPFHHSRNHSATIC